MQIIELTALAVSEPTTGIGCKFRYHGERARVVREDHGSIFVRFEDEQGAYIAKGNYKIVIDTDIRQ
jgi:hypothetical protein